MDEFYDDFLKSMDIWCTCNSHLDKNFKAKRSDICSIKIEKTDDKTVSCIAFDKNNKPIYKSKSKCGPNDIFDFNIGAKLALDRLYEGYDMTPKSKREAYNGKIFVAKYPSGGRFHSRTIRQVVNGRVTNIHHPIDTNDNFGGPYIFKDMTTDQLSKAIKDVFWGPSDAEVLVYFVIE